MPTTNIIFWGCNSSIDCVRRLKKSNENNEKYEIHDFILECSQDYEYFANIRII